MSRRPAAFKQSDVTRAIRGVRAAGVEVSEILINATGSIEIRTGQPAEVEIKEPNEWDRGHGKD
ncbi:MAG: hypothetical protein ACOY5F_21965 [Pseudomonadota bacterium]